MSQQHTAQISAYISAETKKRMERYVRKRGLKKAHVIEMALNQHLSALEAIPERFIVPAEMILPRAAGEKLLKTIAKPPKPTPAMKSLFTDTD